MTKWLAVVGLALAACASDDNGGAGDGDDALPKRGERDNDPTIVSAVAQCTSNDDGSAAPEGNTHVYVRVDATDPMGKTNLSSCAGTIGSVTDQDDFGEGSTCYLYLAKPCTIGESFVVGITVSNATGGVTTASVKLPVAPS